MNLSDWTYEDFRAFVLIHAAHADFKVNMDETVSLLDTLGPKEYSKIQSIYDTKTDYQKIEIIQELAKKYCKEQDQKEKLYNEILNVLRADNHFDASEEAFLVALKKLI